MVQLLFAISLIGGIAYYNMQMGQVSQVENTRIKFKKDVNLFKNEIFATLSNSTLCMQTFQDSSTNTPILKPYKIASRKRADSTFAYKYYTMINPESGASQPGVSGKTGYGNTSFKIERFELRDSNGTLVETAPRNIQDDYLLFITVRNHAQLTTSANAEYTKVIKINMDWGPTNLRLCLAVVEDENSLWNRVTGTPEIFYSDTATPTADFVGTTFIFNDSEEYDKNHTFADPTLVVLHPKGHKDSDVSGVFKASGPNGNITAKNYYYDSDRRLKKNINTIHEPMDLVNNLRGVTFDWEINNSHDYGFIAQEVETVIPEIVTTKGDHLTVDYAKVIPLLVEAVKSQQEELDKIEAATSKY